MNHYDENQNVTATVDFDYSQVDADLFGEHDITESDLSKAAEGMHRIIRWISQGHIKNDDGLLCRCLVVLWIFDETFHSYSMTKMAGRVGKKKQSLGRWVEDFKRRFPQLTKNMKHINNA